MRNLKSFRKKVEAYYKQKVNRDGNRRTQRELAEEIGLNKDELSKRFNAYEDPKTRRKWHLGDDDVLAIVRALAKWSAITTQEQAMELLELMEYPHISSIDWKTEPLRFLRPMPATTFPRAIADDADKQRKEERLKRLSAMLTDHSAFMHDRLSSFVGRQEELLEIRRDITEKLQASGYITITGQAGQGKSSIIAKLVMEKGLGNVAFHFIPFNPGPDYQVVLLRDLMAQLIVKYDLPELYVASESRPALRDYFPKVLKEVVAKGSQQVIFLDGLDQLEEDLSGIRDLSFLPSDLPSGIVFVLGTRPNNTLQALQLLKSLRIYELPNLSRRDFDLILQHRNVQLDERLADRFYHTMQENALYLDLVVKELMESEVISPTEIIKRLARNPENIFTLSMTRLKRQTVEWREVLKPLLGLLLVAREPMTTRNLKIILDLDDERCQEGLTRLGGLVVNDGRNRYTLFHLKLYDFLRQDENKPHKEYIFALNEEEDWHNRLAQWCKPGRFSTIWENIPHDLTEQGRREYARKHYLIHLYLSHKWWQSENQELFEVLDTFEYGQAKIHEDPSTRSYAQDLDLGRQAACWEGWTDDEAIALLPRLWQYTLLRCSLTSRADQYPEAAFRLLILLGRKQEALGLAELLTFPTYKTQIFLKIAQQIREQMGQDSEWLELIMRAGEVAQTIESKNDLLKILNELTGTLAQAGQWERAEQMISSIKDDNERANALSKLGTILVQGRQLENAERVWAQAEQIISTIEQKYERACALGELATQMVDVSEVQKLLKLLHRSWRLAQTREDALNLFSLVSELISYTPGLGHSFFNVFTWVDTFFTG